MSNELPEVLILKLSELLKTTDLAEIEVSQGDLSVRVRAKEANALIVSTPAPAPAAAPAAIAPSNWAKPQESQSDLHLIRSPFIGTFYRAPSPASPSFVEMNQSVSKGQTLCIVEAMKMMNEIEADSGGVIEKVFVENGDPVEFNTPLFGIRRL